MKNKITNEDVSKAIEKLAETVRNELSYDFRVAQSQMWLAEKELIDSLDKNQRLLYENFSKKREVFYNIASDIFVKRF